MKITSKLLSALLTVTVNSGKSKSFLNVPSMFSGIVTGSLTVIVTSFDLISPSTLVANTVVVPAATAVTLPSASTLAMLGLLLVHSTSFVYALDGKTLATRGETSPIVKSKDSGATVTDSTCTSSGAT